MNAAEYDVRLSPELGPNMAALTEALARAVEPSLAQSAAVRNWATIETPEFMEQHFYPYTPTQFVERVFKFPNWEYYAFLCEIEPNDQRFAMAALEILRANPLYIFRYTARNAMLMLADPGYAHSRYDTRPFHRIGNQFLAGQPAAVNRPNVSQIAPRAGREVSLAPLFIQPFRVQRLFAWIEETWNDSYRPMVTITLALMAAAWLGIALLGALWLRRSSRGAAKVIDALWQDGLAASTVVASVLLLYNIVITAAFVDPDFRYHDFIVLLRILLSAYGLILIIRLLRTWRGNGLPIRYRRAHVRKRRRCPSAPRSAVAAGRTPSPYCNPRPCDLHGGAVHRLVVVHGRSYVVK